MSDERFFNPVIGRDSEGNPIRQHPHRNDPIAFVEQEMSGPFLAQIVDETEPARIFVGDAIPPKDSRHPELIIGPPPADIFVANVKIERDLFTFSVRHLGPPDQLPETAARFLDAINRHMARLMPATGRTVVTARTITLVCEVHTSDLRSRQDILGDLPPEAREAQIAEWRRQSAAAAADAHELAEEEEADFWDRWEREGYRKEATDGR